MAGATAFDLFMLLAAPAVLLCLLLSAALSAAEAALANASRPRMQRLAYQGNERARIVLALLDRKDRAGGAILFGRNLANVLAASVATLCLTISFGLAGVAYATLVVAGLIALVSEVLPRRWALLNADRIALALGPSITLSLRVFGPVMVAITAAAHFILKIAGVRASPATWRREQTTLLRGAIERLGGVQPDETLPAETAMLRSVLDFGDRTVGDVMTHRGNLVLIDADAPVSSIAAQILEAPYTRIPLCRGGADNIVGVLHAKALFRAVSAAGGPEAVRIDDVMTPPWFIPESTSLPDQLEAFRKRHEHFALVVDEYGELRGIVTLEDILEEIVGEIEDEHDAVRDGVVPHADGSFTCRGDLSLHDLNRDFGWDLPEEGPTTIAGLILHEARRIPEVGQTYAFYGFRFEILKREGTRVTELRIVPPAAIQSGD